MDDERNIYDENFDDRIERPFTLSDENLLGSPGTVMRGMADGDDIRKMAVQGTAIAHGLIINEANEKIDVMVLEFQTMDGTIHRAMINPEIGLDIANQVHEWIDKLHQEGRCPCPEFGEVESAGDIESDLNRANDIIDAIGIAMKGNDDDRLW